MSRLACPTQESMAVLSFLSYEMHSNPKPADDVLGLNRVLGAACKRRLLATAPHAAPVCSFFIHETHSSPTPVNDLLRIKRTVGSTGKRHLLATAPHTAPAPAPSPGGPACVEYQNPVLALDFPDPSSPVLGVDGWYYSFATNADKKNIQVLSPPICPPTHWSATEHGREVSTVPLDPAPCPGCTSHSVASSPHLDLGTAKEQERLRLQRSGRICNRRWILPGWAYYCKGVLPASTGCCCIKHKAYPCA